MGFAASAAGRKNNQQFCKAGVCRKCGWTEEQSTVLQSPTSVWAGQATLNFKS